MTRNPGLEQEDGVVTPGANAAANQAIDRGVGKRVALGMLAAALGSRVLSAFGAGSPSVEAAAGEPGTQARRARRRKRQAATATPMPQGNAKLTLDDLNYAGWDTDRIQQWIGDKYCMWPDGHAVNDKWTREAYQPVKTIEKGLWATKEIRDMEITRDWIIPSPGPVLVDDTFERMDKDSPREFHIEVPTRLTHTCTSTSPTNLSLEKPLKLPFDGATFTISRDFSTIKTITQEETVKIPETVRYPDVEDGVWIRFKTDRYVDRNEIDWRIPVTASGWIVANFPKEVGRPQDDPTDNGMFRSERVESIVGNRLPSLTGTVVLMKPYIVVTVTCGEPGAAQPLESAFSADVCDRYERRRS